MVDGVLDAALEIAERRAMIQRKMKHGMLDNDLRMVLECACELTGLDGADLQIMQNVSSSNKVSRPRMAIM